MLHKVKYYTIFGWPNHKSSVQANVKQYWPIRHDIYLHSDVLFYKKRILVPDAIKNEFLEIAHKTHQGIISCKKIIQDSFYCPGVSSDIEKIVLNCTIC